MALVILAIPILTLLGQLTILRESVEDDMPRLEDGPRVRRGSVTASPPGERVARGEVTPLSPDAREGARKEGMVPATYLGSAMDNMATLMREMKEMQADNRRLSETLIVPREPVTRTVTADELGTLSTRDSIKALPSYSDGGDLATFIRGLVAELKELGVEDKHWRSISLLKLPPKIKNQVVEHIEGRKPYPELKCALLIKVGKSLRELEHEFFPPRRRCTKDRVQRVREITTMANRVFMLCPTEEALKLFVVRGMLYSELPPHECGILSGQGAETVDDLVDATCLLRENNLARGRDDLNRSTQPNPKCYICNRSGHKAFHFPDKKKSYQNPNNNNRSRDNNSSKPQESKPRKTNLAQVNKDCIKLHGEVNGIPCDFIPDMGAEVTIILGNLVR